MKKGFTLIELLVAMAVASLFGLALYATFSAQQKSTVNNLATSELLDTGAVVLNYLKKQLCMAGYGSPPSLGLYIQDGGPSGADQIFISDYTLVNSTEIFSLALKRGKEGGFFAKILHRETGRIVINNQIDPDSFRVNQYVISDSNNPDYKTAQIIDNSSFPYVLDLDNDLEGSKIVPAIFYCVDSEEGSDPNCHVSGSEFANVLRIVAPLQAGNGKQPLAPNVVDLQVAYQDVNGNWYCTEDPFDSCPMDPFEPEKISLVRLTIVTKQRRMGMSGTRPRVENRSGGSEQPNTIYRVFSTTFVPRNLKRLDLP